MDPKTTTLEQAKDFIRKNFAEGAKCPCCNQLVKRYRRTITNTMAYALILIDRHFRRDNGEWLHVPSYLAEVAKGSSAIRGGDWAKLRLWGLIEPMPGERNDGSKRNGFYRITPDGKSFVHDKVRVPKHLLIYNQEVLTGDAGGATVSIKEALGKKFDYSALMGGTL